MPQAKTSPKPRKKPAAELQAFVNARGRPAVFLFLSESIDLVHVVRLRQLLGVGTFDEIDLVINSGGGSIHAAYQMLELLRLHANKLNACVPFLAKSAATLLCIGSDEIILDELAQLGPLDTQIYEERKGGKGEFTSALNPFKTLEQLQKFSLETLDIAVKMIAMRSGMDLDECIKHAIDFVRVTTGPLFNQLIPEKLGEYSRALSVGTEYGQRLLRRFKQWDEKKRDEVLERLVHGYPSHDYIIDFQELQEIGFQVKLFTESERPAVQDLFVQISEAESLVALVEPVPASNEEGATTAAGEATS
jgi:hypothetical protein